MIVKLIILERKTTINNQSNSLYINSKIYVQEQKYFVFTYRDAHNGKIIGNLSEATYVWQGLDAMGDPIPGYGGSGNLIQNINKTYTLDFKTDLKPIPFSPMYPNDRFFFVVSPIPHKAQTFFSSNPLSLFWITK